MAFKGYWLYFCLGVTVPISVFAIPLHNPSIEADKERADQTDQALEQSKQKQAKLIEANDKITAELAELQKKLVQSADTVRENEAALTDSEEKLAILNEQLQPRQKALIADQTHLEALISAALRLSRMPPEALVMMPGDSEQIIKAAHALQMATASLKQELAEISLEIEELQKLETTIRAKRDAAAQEQSNLTRERKALEKTIAERKHAQDKVGKQEREEAEKTAALAKKSSDIQDMLSVLRHAEEENIKKPLNRQQLRSFASAKGKIKMPAVGKIISSFATPQGDQSASKGIIIAARAGASVVAPYDGEVVYAGTFLNYGKMIILRHSDDFHTLLAGLNQINVQTGEFLLEGEPIGDMGDKESDNHLYMELRKDNQPINPLPWLKKE